MRWFAETEGTAADKIRGLFAKLGTSMDTPRWRGCGFLRTIAELASTPGHPAVKAGAAHKKRFEAWLETELRDQGLDGAAALASLHCRLWRRLLNGETTDARRLRDLLLREAGAQQLAVQTLDAVDATVMEELLEVVMRRSQSSRVAAHSDGMTLIRAASSLGEIRSAAKSK